MSADVKYTSTAGACNLWCIADPETSQVNTSMNVGGIGAFINQPLSNGFLGDELYSVKYARCVDELGKDACKPEYTTLQTAMYLGSPDGSTFSTVNAISSLNVAIITDRPISAVDYFQDKVYALTHFNTVSAQPADASITGREAYYSPGGTGFNLLKPIQNFWSWSVRVVYGFLLIIVVIIAFAIMFRQRLSGNVEVTVQNAIPAIAMAMILVPLSYAISGLFIDFITVGTNAVHEFLIGTPGSPGHSFYQGSDDPDNLRNPLNSSDPYTDRGYYPDDVRVDWLRARDKINVSTTFGAVAQDLGEVSGLNGNVIFLAVGSIVNALTGKGQDADPADFTWVGDIVQFFISIVTLWIGIQIFVHLFKKYITIILYPVMSPFIFATVAIPGNGTKSIMQYVKVMGAAALAFIVTYAMFLLSIIFTSKEFLADVPTFASGSFNPPLLGLKSIGIGSNEMTQLLLTLIGLGIYFSIPNTLKSIDTALGANNPLPKFITTPIDSFRESQRVMFKTAPALAGRAALTGGRFAGNAASSPFRAFSGAMDIADRVRGIDPEKDYRSYRNRQRAARQSRTDSTKAWVDRAKQSKNPLVRGAAAAAGAVANAENTLAGQIEGTGSSLPSDVQRPKVEITGDKILIPRQDIIPILSGKGIVTRGRIIDYSAYNAAGRGEITLATGTLEFKVTGPSVNLQFPPSLVFGDTVPKYTGRTDAFKYGKDLFTIKQSGTTETQIDKLEYKDVSNTDKKVNSGTPEKLAIMLDKGVKPGGNDTVKVDYRIITRDPEGLFGTTTANPSILTPNSAAAILRPGVEVKTENPAYAVKVNGNDDFTTNPFKFSVRLS